jgi:hypothetical protein
MQPPDDIPARDAQFVESKADGGALARLRMCPGAAI